MGSETLSASGTLGPFLEEGDPELRFKDLEQVGHGNFGAVYCAQDSHDKEVVAVKMILIDKKNAETRINDISNELKVLTSLKHEHVIRIKTSFCKNNKIWIVMEYCLGSLVDILNDLSAPFSETLISYVSKSILLALEYIHSLNWIHRDVKAANILISKDETIKLGDFGSTSLKNPTNTFTGSPYWMAPEVILAMEDGEYNVLCDVWSLGITCIELAEMKPPRFEKNAMSALYFIAQNESPTLSKPEKWSEPFIDFVNLCLTKDVESRPTCSTLLEAVFIKSLDEGQKELSKIVVECFLEVESKNSTNYRNVKNFVDHVDSEATSTESETQPSSIGSKTQFSRMGTLSQSINTFKTTSTIVQESLMRENDFFQQHLNEYRQVRKNLNKQLTIFTQKLKATRLELKRSHEKYQELKCQAIEKQLDKMKSKLSSDFEQMLKVQISDEKKFIKTQTMSNRKMGSFKSPVARTMRSKSSIYYSDLFHLRAKQAFDRSLFIQSGMIELITYEREERIKLLNDCKNNYEEEANMLLEHNAQIDSLKFSHMCDIHSMEVSGFSAYVKKCELQLNKKHLQDLKMKPRELKSCEAALKKDHCENIKAEISRYKKIMSENQAQLSKEEFYIAKNKLKREKTLVLTKIENEFNETLAKKMAEIELSYGSVQEKEKNEMLAKNKLEYDQLINYQNFVKNALVTKLTKNQESSGRSTKESIEEYFETINDQIKEINNTSEQKLKQLDDNQIKSTLKYENYQNNRSDFSKELPTSAQVVLSEASKSGKESKLWSFL